MRESENSARRQSNTFRSFITTSVSSTPPPLLQSRQRSVIAATSMAHTSTHLHPGKGLASTKEHTSPAAGNVTDEGMFGDGRRMWSEGHPAANSHQHALLSTGKLNNTDETFYQATNNYLTTTGEKVPSPSVTFSTCFNKCFDVFVG